MLSFKMSLATQRNIYFTKKINITLMLQMLHFKYHYGNRKAFKIGKKINITYLTKQRVIFYRLQINCWKIILLHLFVSHSVHRW